MAAQTGIVTLSKTDWTRIGENCGNVMIQMINTGEVQVAVGPKPAPTALGLKIGRNFSDLPSSVGLGGLLAGGANVAVWAKSGKDSSEDVMVLAY